MLGETTEVGQENAPTAPATPSRSGARKQVKYPGLRDSDDNPVKLDAMPEDYSLKEHKPFVRKDFSDESIWLDWRADQYEAKASAYREEAKMIRKFGSAEDQKAAKKLLKFQKQFADLQAQLSGDGVDVASILASVGVGISDDCEASEA